MNFSGSERDLAQPPKKRPRRQPSREQRVISIAHRPHERRDRDMSPKTMALATLIALVACDASAQAIGTQGRTPNLSGLYRCVRNCAGASGTRIIAYGWSLFLTNELGQTTRAWIDWPGHIWLPALNEGAVYSPDGFTIQFERGSVWVLTEPQPLPGSAY